MFKERSSANKQILSNQPCNSFADCCGEAEQNQKGANELIVKDKGLPQSYKIKIE
jgi:hypothetical protein